MSTTARLVFLLAALVAACLLSSCFLARPIAERLWLEKYRREGGYYQSPQDNDWQ